MMDALVFNRLMQKIYWPALRAIVLYFSIIVIPLVTMVRPASAAVESVAPTDFTYCAMLCAATPSALASAIRGVCII